MSLITPSPSFVSHVIPMQIVSVDDVSTNLLLIEAMSKDLHVQIHSFTEAEEALIFMQEESFDLALVDYEMPRMNGIQLIQQVRHQKADVPIIMITGVSDNDHIKLQAIQAGATEFLNKPLNSSEFVARVKNLLQLRQSQVLLKNKALLLENEVQNVTCDIAQRELETLKVLGRAAEFRDPETGNHIFRVAHYSRILARLCGQNETQRDLIFHAAPLHDVGKIGIPDSILLKPETLTHEEFTIMQTHTQIGFEMLSNTKSIYLQTGAIIAYTHHEKYDGTGYPSGLQREQIPLFGRIVKIADVFDALTSIRPYKNPWLFEKAIDELIQGKKTHFDPDLVELFVTNEKEIKEVFEQYADPD